MTGGSRSTPPRAQRAITLGLPQPSSRSGGELASVGTISSSKGSLEDAASIGTAATISTAWAQQAEPAPPPQVERDAVAAMEASFATAVALAKKATAKPKGKAKGKAKSKPAQPLELPAPATEKGGRRGG